MNLSRYLPVLVVCLGLPLLADKVSVTSVSATQTQIVITYTSTTAGACTISLTDNNGGINPPRDVDPTLFPNANSDLARTTGNGFRFPTVVSSDGLMRTLVLGGHDETKLASDGRWYTTALQVATPHHITLACNGGSDTATIDTSTTNIPLGSTYPELPIPTPGSPLGGIPQPTIDWSDRTAKYIDPITGVLLQRVTAPSDNFDPPSALKLVKVLDVNNAWSNKDGAISSGSSAAATSTPNAPLLVAWDSGITPYCCLLEISDLAVHLSGSGTNGNEIVETCISLDSGQSCASGVIDTPLGRGAAKYDIPSNFPTNFFSSWGVWKTAFGTYDLQNLTYTGVNASGNTVILPSLTVPGFNVDRKPGSRFTLTSCATGSDTTLTVASVDTFAQITTVEAGLNLVNCTYQDWSAGLRLVLKNSGTINLSVSASYQGGYSDSNGSNGNRYQCARDKVKDIQKDCDGKLQSPAASGYLCQFTNGIYLVQDNGRMCLQSGLYGPNIHLIPINSPWIDSKSLIAVDYASPPHLWKMTLNNNGDYTEYVAGLPRPRDKFNYVDVTAATPSINAQISAAGGPVAQALATGMWPGFVPEASIDGNIQYRTTIAGQDSMCMLAWADGNNKLIRAVTAFDTYPLRWGGCHFSPNGVGGFSNVVAGNTPIKFDPTAGLGGPFTMRILAMRKNGEFQSHTIAITAATATNPAVLTSPNNDLDNASALNASLGAPITCSGGTGSWAAINRDLRAHKIDNDTFSVYLDATKSFDAGSLGPMTGNITCSMAPSLSNIFVQKVEGGSTARVTLDGTVPRPGYIAYFPSGRINLNDGDPINFSGLSQTAQYYAKMSCFGCSGSQFEVYKDPAMTVPASQAEVSAATNGFVAYSEVCPSVANVHLPGPLYYDSGFAMARGGRRVRCVTLRVAGEPCSEYAGAAEHSTYPCPSDPSNPSKSSLQNIQPGDAIFDLSHAGNNHEYFLVLQKNKVSENQIDLTVERWYGDSPEWRSFGGLGGRLKDSWAQQHSNGWTAWVIPPLYSAWINYTNNSNWIVESPLYPFSHHDVSQGSAPENLVLSTGYTPGSYDDLVDLPAPIFFATPAISTHNSVPVWASDTLDTMSNTENQSYPNHRQVFGQAPDSEQVWKADWMAINGPYGNAQNNGDGSGIARTLTNIRGTTYDPDSKTSIVYKITNPAPSHKLNIKLVNYLLHASPHTYFQDKSGRASLLTDADVGRSCLVYTAGECRPNSSPGDVFIAMRGVWDPGQCIVNSATLSPPCLYPLWPGAGWAVQVRQIPVDTNGTGVRRLTMGFNLPLTQYSFHNWIPSPDAKWGFFVTNPVQYRPAWGYFGGSHVFAMKLPPWPQPGDIDPQGQEKDRSTFIPYPVSVSGKQGDTVRVSFGYGENGDVNKFYCTTRLETCWTSANASPSNPFVFDGESQARTDCGAGCTVQVPAIPGRVLYYRVEHSNGTTDPPQAVAMP